MLSQFKLSKPFISRALSVGLMLGACTSQAQQTIKVEAGDSPEAIIEKAAHLLPTANQYNYKKLEYTCFVHFGVNTFTAKEWGNGVEDPKVFDLHKLDTDQWCKTAKDAGMKLVVFTAKHHDGFCLWQTRYTKHGVMSSPYKDGKGDVLKELSASCQKYGLKLGVYLSPADLYQIENAEGLYGNLSEYTERVIPRPVEGRPFADKRTFKVVVDDYNEYFMNQLFELLTEYGPVHEVWFDGAHPKRKGGQKYNYLAWKKLIHELAPEAVIFGKGDVRWCGNEAGKTRESEWDVVSFPDDPHQMHYFPDMYGDLGSRAKLADAKYLHFLCAETNTSIREGWFYRDEKQGVRSADDVFDIYERSVGGNSTFLLNIPPNREGRFGDEDVRVLKEVGQRIRATYDHDLLAGAKGPEAMLDNDENTYISVPNGKGSYIIETPAAIELNRFVIQEAIHLQGQRIEKHALDAWLDGQWQEVAQATVVGYKRILRFPTLTTNKLRLRVLEGRSNPSISAVSAHYYRPRPPQLQISRNLEGMVHINAKSDAFAWKSHGQDFQKNLGGAFRIRYTTDGSEPTESSPVFGESFFFPSGEVKAKAFGQKQEGSLAEYKFGYVKKEWTASTESDKKEAAAMAIDADPSTYWLAEDGKDGIVIDMQQKVSISAFVYTPPTDVKDGLMEKGKLLYSKNGKTWKDAGVFEFGNLINDPTPRTHYLKKPVKARYIKLQLIEGAGGSTKALAAEIDVLK